MSTTLDTKPFADTKHVKFGSGVGVLVQTSPSAIEAFDESTSFGCQRKWWFGAVAGLKGPDTNSQALGTELHGIVEDYIGRSVKITPMRDRGAQAVRLFLAVKPTVDEIIEEGIVAVESWMDLELAGVKVIGRIDIRKYQADRSGRQAILDWKTSSDISKYAKTPGQLRRSTQMLLYAMWLEGQLNMEKIGTGEKPGANVFPLEVEHVYVQTKGRPLVERVKAKIDRRSLDVGLDGIILLLEEMKVAAAETDVTKLKADRTKCRMCPFEPQCPKENKTMANLLSRLKAASSPTAEVAPAVVEAPAFSVLPPDAPKSNPALAADPVPGFSVEAPIVGPVVDLRSDFEKTIVEATPTTPEPAAPGRRGRPPGAKNKRMKYVDVPDEVKPGPSPVEAKPEPVKVEVKVEAPKPEPKKAEQLDYQSVTVAFGATIPTAQFANQRMDVTLTARFTGDVDKATAEVSEKVRKLVIKELEKISLTLNGPVLNPGGKS